MTFNPWSTSLSIQPTYWGWWYHRLHKEPLVSPDLQLFYDGIDSLDLPKDFLPPIRSHGLNCLESKGFPLNWVPRHTLKIISKTYPLSKQCHLLILAKLFWKHGSRNPIQIKWIQAAKHSNPPLQSLPICAHRLKDVPCKYNLFI